MNSSPQPRHGWQRLVEAFGLARAAATKRGGEDEEKFRVLFEQSPNPVVLTALPEGRITDANPAAVATSGYSLKELREKSAEALNLWVEPAARQRYLELLRANGSVTGFEAEMRRRNGEIVTVIYNGSLLEIGGCTYGLSSLLDITERKRSERELREKQAQLEEALRLARLGYWEYDVLQDRFFFNDQFYAVLRTTAEREGGYAMSSAEYARRFVHPEDAQVVGEEIGRMIASSDPTFSRELDHRVVFGDGEVGHILVHILVEKNAQGQTVRTHGANMDITERKRAEAQFRELAERQQALTAQLQQAQKMDALGTLAGGIAHDFNNLLTAILGRTELAGLDVGEGHAAMEHLDAIREAGLRSRELVSQILTFSRREDMERSPVLLQGVVEDSLRLLRSTLPAMVRIERVIDAQCAPVRADPTQLHQVLMNLCTNAWHALPQGGGVIEVRLQRHLVRAMEKPLGDLAPGGYVRLSVSDNGSGMDAATVGRIYDPFFTTKPVGKGTGLGLSMVHGIVRAHDGAIFVRSAPGHGTTFDLYFPADTAAAEVPGAQPLPGARGKGERILYVDDDELVANAMTRLLTRMGYDVEYFADPQAALERFKAEPQGCDAVITDLAMPGLPGTELAAELARIRPGVPVMLMTGYLDPSRDEAVRRSGVCAVLRKPLSPEELGEAVRRALGGGRE